jgi:hypothetical protein
MCIAAVTIIAGRGGGKRDGELSNCTERGGDEKLRYMHTICVMFVWAYWPVVDVTEEKQWNEAVEIRYHAKHKS